MAFCSKCGKEIQEGQVCSCSTETAATTAAPVAPTAPAAGGNAFVDSLKDVWTTVQGLFKKPVETTAAHTSKGNIVLAAIIIGAVAILSGLFSMFSAMMATGGSGSMSDLLDYLGSYGASKPNYFLILLSAVLVVLAVAAVSALLYMVLVTSIGGGKLTFNQGLSIASLAVILEIAVIPVAFIIGAIPGGFFDALAGWVGTFAGALSTVYVLMAVKSVVADANKLPLIFAIVTVANSFVTYIINLMF